MSTEYFEAPGVILGVVTKRNFINRYNTHGLWLNMKLYHKWNLQH